jgi:hypothetical protein
MSQNWARSVLDIQVGYSENLDRVREVLAVIAHGHVGGRDVQGRHHRGAGGVGRRAAGPRRGHRARVLKTEAARQWEIAREMRERVKERFDEIGIEIPRPQRSVWQPRPASSPAPPHSRGSHEPASDAHMACCHVAAVLVTGATGYLGRRLVPELPRRRLPGAGMVREPRPDPAPPGPGDVECPSDAHDALAVARPVRRVDVAYSCCTRSAPAPTSPDRAGQGDARSSTPASSGV